MSRTRIIKGSYTKVSEKGHHMYSNESIITNALNWISEVGEKIGVTYGNPGTSPSMQIPAKCIVHFRPKKGWLGEDFGFDWMRLGDTNLITGSGAVFGDSRYETIVAKQYSDTAFTVMETDPNQYNGKFKPDSALFSSLKNVYAKQTIPWRTAVNSAGATIAEDYFCSWLSLFPKEIKNAAGNNVPSGFSNTKATLSLIIDIEEEPDLLRFEDNENFLITPKEISVSGKGKGKHGFTDHITIECLKEFATDQTITINTVKKPVAPQTQETLAVAGKLKVWANHTTRRKKAKIVLIEVRTKPTVKGSATGQKELFERYLKQALIEVDVQTVTVDVSSDPKFGTGGAYVNGSQIAAYYIPSTLAPAGFQVLETYLYAKLKAQLKAANPADENKFDTYFKAFYMGDNGGYADAAGNINGLNGYASGRNVVLFPSKNDQTAAHEFLHSFNLPHTFTNKEADSDALFTYEFKKTENLLDYSHHIPEVRYSLWKWQWEKANGSVP